MENKFFLNAGLQRPPQMSFETAAPSSSSLTIPTTEIDQSQHCLINQDWGNSPMEQSLFDSALSSLVSSPASNSNLSGDCFMIRELIRKLGSVGNGNPGEVLTSVSSSSSCFSTPLNSPPKINLPEMDHTIHSLRKKTPLGPTVAPELAADKAFAERAARFSCFGSRSFNGRTTPFTANDNRFGAVDGKLPRVSSVPSIKAVGSQDESTVSQKTPSGVKVFGEFSRKRKPVPTGKPRENSAGASPSSNSTKVDEYAGDSNSKRIKPMEKNVKENSSLKSEGKQNKSDDTKPAEPPKDYIHVRARRGQATDSHSLAERVRREKISERMKLLQDIVPGCNKVTGKALMLDEIINYVQSLQRQVEFLSMKLVTVNSKLDINVDTLTSKNKIESNNSTPNPIFPFDSSEAALLGQQNPKLQRNEASNGALSQISMGQFNHSALSPNIDVQLPSIHPFPSIAPQYPAFCEDDLHTIVQMGFGQNPTRETPAIDPEILQGSNQVHYVNTIP